MVRQLLVQQAKAATDMLPGRDIVRLTSSRYRPLLFDFQPLHLFVRSDSPMTKPTRHNLTSCQAGSVALSAMRE